MKSNGKDVVVLRPLSAYIWVKCPYCNFESAIDRTGTFSSHAKFRCDGCGCSFDEQTVGIQPLWWLVDREVLRDDDQTALMAKRKDERERVILGAELASSPVKSISMEKTAFYCALVTCPFCEESCITRYNAPQPFVGQWCPNKECGAELVVTISAKNNVGGDVSEWYKRE